MRRHCDHDANHGERKPKRNLKGRGFKSKCLPIFVCYLLWTIIKQRPLVVHIASVISPGLLLLLERKRVVKNEILEIFKAACCWSVNLYYGKSEGQWARCLNLAAETWVNSNLLKLFDRKTVMKSSPLGYFSRKSNQKSRQNSSLSLSMDWSGSPKNKQNWTKYRNRNGNIPIF